MLESIMPQPDVYVSVIVPAYNEAERIAKTLLRFNEYLSPQPYQYEILVVNDGSTDNTKAVVEGLKNEIENLYFLDRGENRGKGYTVKEGMLKAHGKIRLFADADNATDISHFEKMRPFFDQGYDVVVCSRDPKDATGAEQAVPQPLFKRFLGYLGNLFIQYMAVPGIWDTQCGFKAFRNHAAEKIFSKTRISRWAFDVEVLAIAKLLHYKIAIVPAHWVNDLKTHVKFSGYMKSLWEVFKINRNLKKDIYH